MVDQTERQFRLRICIENDAFADDAAGEVAMLLRAAAARIEATGLGWCTESLNDANGNEVGSYATKTRSEWGA